MTAIHRIDPELWITTPAGEAYALFLIDYGPNVNSVWVVALLDTGAVIQVDICEVRVMVGNAMYNVAQPEPFAGRVCQPYGGPKARTEECR